MSGVTATLRVESPDLPLTATVTHDESATVQPVSSAGTVPHLGGHLFTVQTADFDRFETGLERDHTVDTYERVAELGEEAVYRLEYGPEATVFSAAVAALNGVSLEWANEGSAWTVRVWVPDREALASLWEFATEQAIDFSLERVATYEGGVSGDPQVTADQREALLRALELGYFEDPRGATLGEVATELGISEPAASKLLRRGLRRLVVASVGEEPDQAA